MKETTFSRDCLQAISHLSSPMQDRIIVDVTRYRLTGEIPEKMSPMRRALFNVLLLMLAADHEQPVTADTPVTDSVEHPDISAETSSDTAHEPNYIAIDAFGRTTPLYIPAKHEIPPGTFAQNLQVGT